MPNSRIENLKGTFVALITPMDSAGNILFEALPDLLEFHRRNGVAGAVSGGTNSEATSLSVAERKRLLEATLAQGEGLHIMAGTGATSVTDALDLTRHAAECGAVAALVVPPFFVKTPSVEGLYRYFMTLLDGADIPLLLYHIPAFTAVLIPDELIDRLLGHPNLVGMKNSTGDVEHTVGWLEKYPQLALYSGSDLIHEHVYPKGAHGCISGLANAFPELIAAVWTGYTEDPSLAKMREAQQRVLQMAAIVRNYPFVANNKAILAHRGFPRFYVRPSLVDLTAEQEEKMIGELKAIGLL